MVAHNPSKGYARGLIEKMKMRNVSMDEMLWLCAEAGKKFKSSSRENESNLIDSLVAVYDAYVIACARDSVESVVSELAAGKRLKVNKKTHPIAVFIKASMFDEETKRGTPNIERWAKALAYYFERGTSPDDLRNGLTDTALTNAANDYRSRHGVKKGVKKSKSQYFSDFKEIITREISYYTDKVVRPEIVYWPDGRIVVTTCGVEEISDVDESGRAV